MKSPQQAMPCQDEDEDSVEEKLIAEYLKRIDSGEQLTEEMFIEEHQEYTEELSRFFENVKFVKNLAASAPRLGLKQQSIQREQPVTDGDDTLINAEVDTSISNEHAMRRQLMSANDMPEMFGRYRIKKVLGQGAMGAVYLANDTQLDRDVALKVPKFENLDKIDQSDMLTRFYREARATATLRHPNICPVYDVGQFAGQHYITMAYIEGRPLKDFTQSGRVHSERHVAKTIYRIALGLAEAHAIGVIHRDLKPANIMMDSNGEPVVMDFGLARRKSLEEENHVTQTGTILGTPAYMSPEQVAGDQELIGPQTDIYSLGVIFYELATGLMPFRGNLMALLQQISLNKPQRPGELRANLSPRLEEICLKMIEGNLQDRYQTMREVSADLLHYLKSPQGSHKKQAELNTQSDLIGTIADSCTSQAPHLIAVDSLTPFTTRYIKQRTPGSRPMNGRAARWLTVSIFSGLLLVLGVVFTVRLGKYDVRIQLDDPGIKMSIDGEELLIENGSKKYKLKAGLHSVQLETDDLKLPIENFNVTSDGETVLRAEIIDGQLAAYRNDSLLKQTKKTESNSPQAESKIEVSKETYQQEENIILDSEVELPKRARSDNKVFETKQLPHVINLFDQLSSSNVVYGNVKPHRKGEWVFWEPAAIHIPVETPDEYQLTVDFEHTAKKLARFNLIIPVGKQLAEITLSSMPNNPGSGLQIIQGKVASENQSFKPTPPFRYQSRNLLQIDVRPEGRNYRIRASIADQLLFDLILAEHELSLREELSEFPHGGIGILTDQEAIFVVRKIELNY